MKKAQISDHRRSEAERAGAEGQGRKTEKGRKRDPYRNEMTTHRNYSEFLLVSVISSFATLLVVNFVRAAAEKSEPAKEERRKSFRRLSVAGGIKNEVGDAKKEIAADTGEEEGEDVNARP